MGPGSSPVGVGGPSGARSHTHWPTAPDVVASGADRRAIPLGELAPAGLQVGREPADLDRQVGDDLTVSRATVVVELLPPESLDALELPGELAFLHVQLIAPRHDLPFDGGEFALVFNCSPHP